MKTSKLKRWHKISLGAALFFALLLFAAPRIAKSYIIKNSNQLIGRKIEIGKIRLNYFSGVARIHALKLYENDGSRTFVSFDKFLVNLQYWPLIKNKLVISEISLDNLYTQIEQKAEWFNFSDIAEPSDSVEIEDEVAEGPSAGMVISLNNISLSNSHIQYSDLLLDHTIAMNDINLHVPGFTLNQGSTNLEVNFKFVDGGGLYSKLDLNQTDSTYKVKIALDSLNLEVIEPYAKSSIDISGLDGLFSSHYSIQGSLQHIMQIHISGWSKLEHLSIIGPQNRNILNFKSLKTTIDTFLLDKNQIEIGEISLVDPYVYFGLIDSTNNWLAMMPASDPAIADTATSDTANSEDPVKFTYSLGSFELYNGEIAFEDKTLRHEFKSTIHNLYIQTQNINPSTENVKVDISAELNHTAKIKSNLELDFEDFEDIKADFELQRFAMKDVEPYLKHYFGYPVEQGILNFSTYNDIKGEAFKSDNNIHVRQFTLGTPNKKEAEYKLPLNMAIGVLSDKDGIIDFNIPVESNEEETTIGNLGKLVLKTIGNLIVKAATSPTNLLSNLYQVDPDKIKHFDMEMFETTLSKDGMETLDIIARILEDKPALAIDLTHVVNKQIFTDSLAYTKSLTALKTDSTFASQEIFNDSILTVFLQKETASTDSNLHVLCKNFIGSESLQSSYDSILLHQKDFVFDYMRAHKDIAENRINFKQEIPDTLKNGGKAVFYIDFTTVMP